MFLHDRDRQELQKRFSTLRDLVSLVFFTQELECQFCRETRQLRMTFTNLIAQVNPMFGVIDGSTGQIVCREQGLSPALFGAQLFLWLALNS